MRAGRVAAAASCLLLFGQLAGCAQQAPRTAAAAEAAVEFTRTGACGEAFFWAATASGDTAVTVAVDVRDRRGDGPTTVRFHLPDPAVDVTVLDGRDVPRNFCTDLPDAAADPAATQPATAGAGVVTVGPPPRPGTLCGEVEGALSVDGLVAEDGRELGPIRVSTASIGCYAG